MVALYGGISVGLVERAEELFSAAQSPNGLRRLLAAVPESCRAASGVLRRGRAVRLVLDNGADRARILEK